MDRIPRRGWLGAAALCALALTPWTAVQAQTAAVDNAKIVVGFPAGSTPDVLARRVAERLAPLYAKSVIVENRTGAGGQLAVAALKGAAADGKTILLTPMSMLGIYPHTYKNLPYNISTDIVPVSMGVTFDAALAVGAGVPAEVKTVPQFLAWAKANPGKANVGSPATGSTLHFLSAELSRASGVPLTHVGYRGTTAAMPELIAGQLPAMISPVGEFLRYLPEGKVRILGTSGLTRNEFTPTVPTFAEQGYKDVLLTEWYGFYLPAKAPPATVKALNTALRQVLVQPELKETLTMFGMVAAPSSPDELNAALQQASTRWAPIIQRIGFSADN
ncbi:twin-arginine translocation pathway signal protein [Ottowia sp. GY511]|uniref:Bug family tripartite tricarboxylate transporter substrate binding protein n=1 Tax=Ottowia flava TaxID=2675430 RepID=A0ABW4KSH8_9BURK|nr:Bug family tripartite tricarboxylate transporter substrate binding protein [Ottowia sp. GY511]TXK33088.1 twin-arginine translocation pathway signal protein [Ottowia sp. GY511]